MNFIMFFNTLSLHKPLHSSIDALLPSYCKKTKVFSGLLISIVNSHFLSSNVLDWIPVYLVFWIIHYFIVILKIIYIFSTSDVDDFSYISHTAVNFFKKIKIHTNLGIIYWHNQIY